MAHLTQACYKVTGFKAMFTADIPIGAGLSSSAVLEVAFASAITRLSGQDISLAELAKIRHEVTGTIYQCCRYVIEENDRIQATGKTLVAGDLPDVSRLMYASHHGLRELYVVSCPELDLLIDLVKDRPEVLGPPCRGRLWRLHP